MKVDEALLRPLVSVREAIARGEADWAVQHVGQLLRAFSDQPLAAQHLRAELLYQKLLAGCSAPNVTLAQLDHAMIYGGRPKMHKPKPPKPAPKRGRRGVP